MNVHSRDEDWNIGASLQMQCSVFLGALTAVLIIRVLDGTLLQLAALQIECSKP